MKSRGMETTLEVGIQMRLPFIQIQVEVEEEPKVVIQVDGLEIKTSKMCRIMEVDVATRKS